MGKKIAFIVIAVLLVIAGIFGGITIYGSSTAKDFQSRINDGALDVAVAAQAYISGGGDISSALAGGNKIYGRIESGSGNDSTISGAINKALGSKHEGKYYALVFKDSKLVYTLYCDNEINDSTIYNDNPDDQLEALKN